MGATVALAAAVIALVAAPAAVAQAPPPDERAAAQAFADAAKRLIAAAEALPEDPPWLRSCRALRRDPPPRHQGEASVVVDALVTRDLIGRLQQPVLRLRSELAQAQTAEPALISGRAALRRLGRTIAAFPPPAGDPCAAYRSYVRAGYPRAAARGARALEDRLYALVTLGMTRRIMAAGERMVALGVPVEDAQAFMQLAD